jgi:hypothetical protein
VLPHVDTCRAAGTVNGAQGARQDISPATISRVVLPLAAALVLGNVDRICMSVAIIPMAAEFGWPSSVQVLPQGSDTASLFVPHSTTMFIAGCHSKPPSSEAAAPRAGPTCTSAHSCHASCCYAVQGLVQSAFLWGYTITQLLGGSLADRHGGKMVLGAGVLWFSAASILLPLTLTPALTAAGLALPLAMVARCMVVRALPAPLPALPARFIPRQPGMQRSLVALLFWEQEAAHQPRVLKPPLVTPHCSPPSRNCLHRSQHSTLLAVSTHGFRAASSVGWPAPEHAAHPLALKAGTACRGWGRGWCCPR